MYRKRKSYPKKRGLAGDTSSLTVATSLGLGWTRTSIGKISFKFILHFFRFTFFHPKIRSASRLNNFITSIEKVSCRSGNSLSYLDMLFCVHALGLLCHGIFKSPGNRRRKIRRRKTDCFCNYLIIVLIYYINNIKFYSI